MNERTAVGLTIVRPNGLWWKLSLLVVLLTLVYSETLFALVRIWGNRPDYSHGFLIPLISLYFIWAEREKLKTIHVRPSVISGSMVILCSGFLLIIGKTGGISLLSQISLITIISGLVLMLLGRENLRLLALPIAYLIFMMPILDILFDNIRRPFQLFSAIVTSQALRLMDIPVFQKGTFLELPNITLEVARACSGVQYLVSIIAIGIPLAYFTQKTWKLRITLVVSAAMIGIIINPLRIILISLWSVNGGDVVHGPMHIFQGLFVSVAGYVALFMLAFIFAKTAPRELAGTAPVIPSDAPESAPAIDAKGLNTAWIISIAVLLGLAAYLNLHEPKPVPLSSSLEQFPLEFGAWKGIHAKNTTSDFAAHGADSETAVDYLNNSNRKIRLYVGYFESQKPDKKIVDYRLQGLFDLAETIRIPLGSGLEMEVNKVQLTDNGRMVSVMYWYDLNGRIISGNIKAKLLTMLDAILDGRSNGAIIIVSSEVGNADEELQVTEDEVRFIQDALPALKQRLSTGMGG